MRGDQIMQAGQGLTEGWDNLAIGDPYFLRAAMHGLYPEDCHRPAAYGGSYPDPQGLGVLRRQLSDWGDGGCFGADPALVVVANGATQALAAAVYACRKASGKISEDFVEESRNYLVGAPAGPYYAGLPHIVGLGGGFFARSLTAPDATVLAYPNNPSGCGDALKLFGREHPEAGTLIWDAAYAHRQYGYHERHRPDARIGVGSASKALGLCGIRAGWAWFPTEELASAAVEYVERSSAGASALSQEYLNETVHRCRTQAGRYADALLGAGGRLDAARTAYRATLGPLVVDEGDGGMFAWFRARKPETFRKALGAAGALLVPGPAFGSGAAHWRMNLGAELEVVERACERIAAAHYEAEAA